MKFMTPSCVQAATDVMRIEVDATARIATLTMHRPEKRNALSSALARDLRAAVAAADADDAVDVLVLTGSDPAFCAGLDLKELGSATGSLMTRDREGVGEAAHTTPWTLTEKPIIGAINGVATTGGFEIALQCDFLVASERATFGDTHARVGILPGWGMSVLLPQAIGYRRALEMSMTGNFLNAQEALHFGLVNHVVPHDDLLPTAHKLASDMANNNADAVRALLQSYRAIHRMTVGDGLAHENTVSRDWSKRTFDPAVVEARRQNIINRGRTQV
jgi:enoyl-CoA hydratase